MIVERNMVEFGYDGYLIRYEDWPVTFKDCRMVIFSKNKASQHMTLVEVWNYGDAMHHPMTYMADEYIPIHLVDGFKAWIRTGYKETMSLEEFFKHLFDAGRKIEV